MDAEKEERQPSRFALLVSVMALAIALETPAFAPYSYGGWSIFTIVVTNLIAWLLIGCAIFWRRSKLVAHRPFTAMRVGAAALGVALMVGLAFNNQNLVTPVGPQSLAQERAAVEVSYTDEFAVENCGLEGSDQTIAKRMDSPDTCTLVIPLNKYSVVVYPDGSSIKLEAIQHTTSTDGKVLTLTFPSKGGLRIFLFDDTDARYAAHYKDDMTIDVTAPHFTALTSRWSA